MSEDLGKITGFTLKLKGWCRDKDGYISHFTEKDVTSITWTDKDD